MKRYEALIRVIQTGSFTRAAQAMGYTQSAVSQMVQALEQELGTTLLLRQKGGVVLTRDGAQYLPYIRALDTAHAELEQKHEEMQGLTGALVRIGTFSSVSVNWLPALMQSFRQQYPAVAFDLQQGEYTNIGRWITEGRVDFGFVNPDAVSGLTVIALKHDPMLAVLPPGHPLAAQETVSPQALACEPYILLDEGELSEPLNFFAQNGLKPNIQFKVFDDYTIMSMVEQGLGISILPSLVLNRHNRKIVLKPISPNLERVIALAYRDKKTLPLASRRFIDEILKRFAAKPMADA